ncbi:hypothetical protein Tco_1263427 [Tanacetum coccineum]
MKKIPSSCKPKTSKDVRQSKPKKTVIDTQHAEESVATSDATNSLEDSEWAEELKNQTKPADAKKLKKTKGTRACHRYPTVVGLRDDLDVQGCGLA